MVTPATSEVRRASTWESTETKLFSKTSEFFVWVATVAAVLIAAMIVDGGADGFNTADAWRYVTYLSVAYMISRGLAKAGSREPYRD